jgi:hypothetical protein
LQSKKAWIKRKRKWEGRPYEKADSPWRKVDRAGSIMTGRWRFSIVAAIELPVPPAGNELPVIRESSIEIEINSVQFYASV